MLCYINYISASRRLKEVEKTVQVLKSDDSERDVPSMVLAQRDFLKIEKGYFGKECRRLTIVYTLLIALSVFLFNLFHMIYK